MRIVVAGAGGVLGGLVVRELEERGHTVCAIVRRRPESSPARETVVVDGLKPGAWRGVCDGADAVFSSLGASVNPSPMVRGGTYTKVDAPANLALLEEARRAGVRRYVYTSLIDADRSRSLDYAEGHERVVDGLKSSGMPATVLRPTGFFCAMTALVDMARKGAVPVFGDGSSRTNPICEHDLACAAADALADDAGGVTELKLGGPDIFTRREIAELAFRSLGRRPRLIPFPVWLAHAGAAALHPFNARAAHFTRFAAHVMTHDCLAPRTGVRRLDDRFRDHAGRS
ncbi:MAG TPA: NAD(P)H-binding protein [Phycisphaerales bacterium]|nr:NAD(P)H-binding protein [Phycisphaerales bacterium]